MADQFTKEVIVGASVDAAYRAWADFENFPHVMKYISSVAMIGERSSDSAEGAERELRKP